MSRRASFGFKDDSDHDGDRVINLRADVLGLYLLAGQLPEDVETRDHVTDLWLWMRVCHSCGGNSGTKGEHKGEHKGHKGQKARLFDHEGELLYYGLSSQQKRKWPVAFAAWRLKGYLFEVL